VRRTAAAALLQRLGRHPSQGSRDRIDADQGGDQQDKGDSQQEQTAAHARATRSAYQRGAGPRGGNRRSIQNT